MQLRILTAADVHSCLAMEGAIEAMRTAFTQISSGEAVIPDRLSITSEDGGKSLFMPGYLPREGYLAAKVVSVFGDNPRRGLPTIQGVVLVLDSTTGAPVGLMDGTYLTALRTGAASGLATDFLALPGASVLTVFGAGPQSRTQVEAIRTVRPIREIRLVSRSETSAEALAKELDGVDVRVMDDPSGAVRGAQIIVTATDSHRPVFPGMAVDPGVHVNAVGAYTPTMREVDGDLVAKAKVVVDARATVLSEAGDLVHAIAEKVFSFDEIYAELGEVVAGSVPGRESSDEVTLFKSVGNAAQDVSVAGRVLGEAERLGVGTVVELS
jgi:ornithine cyclodeaminase/alanine dehydrogenase-like protein (mu-crystallin family)